MRLTGGGGISSPPLWSSLRSPFLLWGHLEMDGGEGLLAYHAHGTVVLTTLQGTAPHNTEPFHSLFLPPTLNMCFN